MRYLWPIAFLLVGLFNAVVGLLLYATSDHGRALSLLALSLVWFTLSGITWARVRAVTP